MSKPLAICDVDDEEEASVNYISFNSVFNVLKYI